jgi:hypothetical protein
MTFRFLKPFVLLLLAASLAILPACDSYFFYPQRSFVANPYLDRVFHEDVFFEAPDGVRLHGWFLRPNDEPRGTILFFHGNAENISTHVGSVLWLAMEGYQVFLIDYRGYGRSEGTPEMKGIHVDALAAIDRLFRMEGVDKDRIVVFGQSLGGAVAVYAVATDTDESRGKRSPKCSSCGRSRPPSPFSLRTGTAPAAGSDASAPSPSSSSTEKQTRSFPSGTGNDSIASPKSRSSCGSPPGRVISGRCPTGTCGNGSFRTSTPSSGGRKAGRRNRGNGNRGDRFPGQSPPFLKLSFSLSISVIMTPVFHYLAKGGTV